MIKKVSGPQLSWDETFPIDPDRPKPGSALRKLLFFLLREGASSTYSKAASRLFRRKQIDHQIVGAMSQGRSGISFDAGKTFYVHANGASDNQAEQWHSPFSVNSDVEVTESCIPTPKHTGSVFLLGSGDYARTYSLKHFHEMHLFAAVDYSDTVLSAMRTKFENTCNSYAAILPAWRQAKSPIAIVASFHSDHARQAHALFKHNSDGFIFVEKPPLVDYRNEFPLLSHMYEHGAKLEIGFNRRYAPATRLLLERLEGVSGPTFINISVNEVQINASHWYHWPNQGTRITGNACHWIDLCQLIVRATPTRLSMTSSSFAIDNVVLTVEYDDGSIANMIFSDSGSTLRGVQETIEVKRSGHTFFIDDFLTFRHDSKKGRSTRFFWRRDKGHDQMYRSFRERVHAHIAGHAPFRTRYPLEDLDKVTRTTAELTRMYVSRIRACEMQEQRDGSRAHLSRPLTVISTESRPPG